LGAILYECLTGRPPFRAATVMDTLGEVLNSEPAPPSRVQPGVPRDLETVCLKCLEKERARRYATALELAEDLGRFLHGEPVRVLPVGRLERGWRWCKRNPVVAGLLALVALLLGAGTTISTFFAVAAAEQARVAGKAEAQAKDQAEAARQAE